MSKTKRLTANRGVKGGYKFNKGGRKGKDFIGDCVIRAFAIHQRWSYRHTANLVASICPTKPSKKNGCLTAKGVEQFAAALGLARVSFASAVPVAVAAHRLQNAIINMKGHVVACRDGVIHDIWDSRHDQDDPEEMNTATHAWIDMIPKPDSTRRSL